MHSIVRMGIRVLDLLELTFNPAALRSYLAEFISTFLFVFIGVGSAMSAGKVTPDTGSDESVLVAVALAHAFAMFVAVYVAANVSGGHLNPAVTFGLAVGGHISLTTGIFYWAAQLLGSAMACLLLMLVTAGQAIPTHGMSADVSMFEAAVMESVMTFALVYTVYATRDPKKGTLGITGPIAVGFVAGSGILAVGPSTGGSMNPARSFGPAVITGDFRNHGVYWVGPLVGAGFAALVYENMMSIGLTQPPSVSETV